MCSALNPGQCLSCNGRGWKSCNMCNGHGYQDCFHCRGTGSWRCFIRLRVQYKTHVGDFITKDSKTALPVKLVRKAGGAVLFQSEGIRVFPLNNYPDARVNEASQRLVREHAVKIASKERILIQRHRVRSVPVSECSYSYKGKKMVFFVYGTENRAHAPDYPQQCCCGCSVL
jgi:hypothetical protein